MSDQELKDLKVYFAYVFSGTIEDFLKIRDYAEHFTDARLIYQSKSLGYLRIEKEQEVKA